MIVIHQIDAHREALHNFDEIAGRVLRWQQCEGRSGAESKAGDTSFEILSSAVHVGFDIDALSDSQVSQLRFLEVRIDPSIAKRPYRHQALADLDIVTGIYVAPRDHAIDLGHDRAVA